MESIAAYIAMDRRQALAKGEVLPNRTEGAILFADISGYTPLTKALMERLGPKRGAEVLTQQINHIFALLITQVHSYRGSIIGFGGDAITCWFDGDDGERGTACALRMQQVMQPFVNFDILPDLPVSLTIKVAVVTGPVRRFQIGDPNIQLLDVIAGATVEHMAAAERKAEKGEVLVSAQVAEALQNQLTLTNWRSDEQERQFVVVSALANSIEPTLWTVPTRPLADTEIRSRLLYPVYERLKAGRDEFLGEFRQTVALFLKFSGIAYDDDDAAGEKLSQYIGWMQNVLYQCGGYLIKLTIGDKGSYCLATFGAPVMHDDSATSAVAAALELQLPPQNFSYIKGIQIGLSQGWMLTGAFGSSKRRAYDVLGDEANIAARLMSRAKPGQILVSQRVAMATNERYYFDYIGSVILKGQADPLAIFTPIATQPTTSPTLINRFNRLPVGRETELTQLEHLLAIALRGQKQVITLGGAAGVGKSHLMAALVGQAVRLGVRVAVGSCQRVNRNSAYVPWRQIFREMFALLPHQEPGLAQIEQVSANINGFNPDWLIRLPLLRDLLGLPFPDNPTIANLEPTAHREALYHFAAQLLQRWSEDQPLLLIIEDAHWLDEASLALTVALSRALVDTPLALVLTHRPLDANQFADLSQVIVTKQLALPELAPANVAEMIYQCLGTSVSNLVITFVQAKAQGNPFFIEELLDTLRETGHLVQASGETWDLSSSVKETLRRANCLVRHGEQGEWVLRPDAPLVTVDLGLPDSVHGLALARLGRLPESHQLTLKTASAIGSVFEVTFLAQAHPHKLNLTELGKQIQVMQQRDLIYLEPSSQTYSFRHHLIQEAIYDSLLSEQQRRLHRAIGRALERLQPDAIEALAYHYSHSGVRSKTLFYLNQAARKMQSDYALEAALHYYTQALAIEERWEWRKGQTEVAHILGRRDLERAGLEQLETLLVNRKRQGSLKVFELAFLRGQYYEILGEYDPALEAAEKALSASQKQKNPLIQIRCLGLLGVIERRQAHYDQAKIWYSQAWQLYQDRKLDQTEISQTLIETITGLGTVYRHQEAFDLAQSCYEQALEMSRLHANKRGEALALDVLGILAYYQGYFVKAANYHKQALGLWQTVGDWSGEGVCLTSLAHIARDSGDFDLAEKYLKEALQIQEATGNLWEQLNIWIDWGGLYYELGELDQAKQGLEHGLHLSEILKDENGKAYVLCNLGLVLSELGQLAVAEETLREGLSLAEEQKDGDLASSFYFYLSLISLQAGRLTQAIEQAQTALDLRNKLGLRLRTADDLATLAAAYLTRQQLAEALTMAEEALTILAECGGEGPEFPQRAYFIGYQVLTTAGNNESAQVALQAAYDLVMARANSISNPDRRYFFLEQRALSREIVAAYKSKGLTST